jgi:Fe-S-cluster-containing dehydrogenase component
MTHPKAINRRNFLKAAAAGGAAAAVLEAPKPAQARGNNPMPPQALGLLYDSTLCIGCKACVNACKQSNGMPAEFSTTDKLWDTPLDLSGKTLNVIKAYKDGSGTTKDAEANGYAFIKNSCLHCVDPSCVSACPVSAMLKDPVTGIVTYNKDSCIGCRYCVAACPFGVPRFQYDTATPQINKCQLCKHRLPEGKWAACAEVCPTGATLYGSVAKLTEEAKRRLALAPGELTAYPRGNIEAPFPSHEKPAPKYINRLYGEREVGGTQMRLLAGVSFAKLGYPDLPDQSYASKSESIQSTLYGGMILPLAALGGLMWATKRATKNADHED